MELEKLDEVAKLKARREQLLALFNTCGGDVSLRCDLLSLSLAHDSPGEIKAAALVGNEPIVAAIMNAAADDIVAIDNQLKQLGVTPPAFEHPAKSGPEGDISTASRAAKYWRDCATMFSSAWSRSLGQRRPKIHFIDELVVGTELLRRQVETFERAVRSTLADGTLDEAALRRVVSFELAEIIMSERDRLKAQKGKA